MKDNRKETIRKSITQVGINPIFKDVMANKPPEGYTKTKNLFIDSVYDMVYQGKAVPLENYGITFQDIQDFANGELDLNIKFDLNHFMFDLFHAGELGSSNEDFSSINYISFAKKISEKFPWAKTAMKERFFSFSHGFSTKNAAVCEISPYFYDVIMAEAGESMLQMKIKNDPELLEEYVKIAGATKLSWKMTEGIRDGNYKNTTNTLIYYKFFDFEPIRYIINVEVTTPSFGYTQDEEYRTVFTFLISDTKFLITHASFINKTVTASELLNYKGFTNIFYKNAGNDFTPIELPEDREPEGSTYLEIFGQDLQYYLDHGGDINVIREWAHAAGSEEALNIYSEANLSGSELQKEEIKNNPDLTEEEKQEQIKEIEDAFKFYETFFEKFDSADICFFLFLGLSINPELDEFISSAPMSNNNSFSFPLRFNKHNIINKD